MTKTKKSAKYPEIGTDKFRIFKDDNKGYSVEIFSYRGVTYYVAGSVINSLKITIIAARYTAKEFKKKFRRPHGRVFSGITEDGVRRFCEYADKVRAEDFLEWLKTKGFVCLTCGGKESQSDEAAVNESLRITPDESFLPDKKEITVSIMDTAVEYNNTSTTNKLTDLENSVQVFNNEEFGSVRTIVIDGKLWFIAKEIADILGYGNGRDALRKHVDEEDKKRLTYKEIQTSRFATSDKVNNNGMTIINESGLYSLILSSKLPSAKEFKRWVTSEVIPTIRKTGGYVADADAFLLSYLPNADEQTKVMFKAQLSVIRALDTKVGRLETKVKEDAPKVIFAEQIAESKAQIKIETIAKLLCKDGITIGRNQLYKFLREHKVLLPNNVPYQKYLNAGYFEVKEYLVMIGDRYEPRQITLCTGKGQIFVTNLVKALYKVRV